MGIYLKTLQVLSYPCKEKKDVLENVDDDDKKDYEGDRPSCEPVIIRKPHCTTKDSVKCEKGAMTGCSKDNMKKCSLVPRRRCRTRSKLHCEDFVKSLCQ